MADGILTLTDWLESDIRFVSATQGFDFRGSLGKIIAALLFGIAELLEQETRRERQRVGIDAAKERGAYQGRRPGTTKGQSARARELRERGFKVAGISTAMGVSTRTVRRYLSRAA
jgi:DNA invertase Pin-like site-specific DNA recombinase